MTTEASSLPSNDLPHVAFLGQLTLGAIARLDPETLLLEGEAAQVLRLSKRTLERRRSLGQDPQPQKSGTRRVTYSVGTILKFAGFSVAA